MREAVVELSTCRKSVVLSINWAMPVVHSRTCGRIYFMKAVELHRPRIMILTTEQSARKRAMAAPDRRECVPMSIGW